MVSSKRGDFYARKYRNGQNNSCSQFGPKNSCSDVCRAIEFRSRGIRERGEQTSALAVALLQEPEGCTFQRPPREVPPESAAGGEERRPLAVESQEEVEDGHWALSQAPPPKNSQHGETILRLERRKQNLKAKGRRL